MEVKHELVAAAAKCVEMARTLVKVTTSSINVGSSGTLQAALFHATGYLWNATITLLLYFKSHTIHETLADTIYDRNQVTEHIESATAFFITHQEAIAFARGAAQKAQRLLKKASGRGFPDKPSITSTDIDSGITLPNLESPEQILDFVSGFDMPTFDFGRRSFDHVFEHNPHGDDPTIGSQEVQGASPHWSPEGESFYFYGTPGQG